MQRKKWWKSRTLWFNALVATLGAVEASVHLVQPYVAGNIYGYGLLLLSVGNTFLRFLTTQGVGK